MKLKSNFITQTIDDVQFLVPVGGEAFSGIIRSNESAAFIVDQLKNETTPEAITDAMANVYDAPRSVLEADVNAVIEKLRSINAITE